MFWNDRLHPETLRVLRELVNLHDADALIEAILQMKREQDDAARTTSNGSVTGRR